MKNFIAAVFLITSSTLIALLALEAGWRLWIYHEIKGQVLLAALAQLPSGPTDMSQFDAATGYRYRPNLTIEKRDAPFPVAWTTNSHGHIARGEYPVEKPPDEFRIGLVGDSMTANVTNSIRWGVTIFFF